MVTIQKHHYISFLHSFGRSLLAVFFLVVSTVIAGATLPSEAATTYTAPKVTAKSLNTANYQASMSWTPGNNPSTTYWLYKYTASGVTTYQKVTTNGVRSVSFSSLPCGRTYTFSVAVSTSGGTLESPYGSATAAVNCASTVLSSVTASGDTVTANYTNASGFNTNYYVYYKAGSGAYASVNVKTTSYSFSGACGTTYSIYVVPYGNAQHGSASAIKTATTAACPAPPTPTPTPTPTSKPKPVASKPVAPATPVDFTGTIQNAKTIDLSWQAVSGADHYTLSRSSDGSTWTPLTNVSTTSYTDTTADYATTYYYQLAAMSAAGQASPPASAQITTDARPGAATQVQSNDNTLSIQIPEGAVTQDYKCTLTPSAGAVAKAPTDRSILAGPYQLQCTGADGQAITHFAKPVSGTLTLTAQNTAHYGNLTVLTTAGKGWQGIKTAVNSKTHQLQFNLNDTTTVAAFGTPTKDNLPMILVAAAVGLLLLGSFLVPLLLKRRRPPAAAVTNVSTPPTPREQFQQVLAAPECVHKALAQQVTPSSHGCLECEQQHTSWVALRICLICGHVGCSDDSPNQHALQHFEETGHPIIYEYNNPAGNGMGWCYIDKTYI